MTPTATACAALSAAGRRARRQRVRLLSRSYDRARDLPRILPIPFADHPSNPFARINPVYAYEGDWRIARTIMACVVAHIGMALAERARRDVEARLDHLRVVLAGEAAIYRALRMRALFMPAERDFVEG